MRIKLLSFVVAIITMVTPFTLVFAGCADKEAEFRNKEVQQAITSLDRSRQENAEQLPDLSKNISDIRLTIIDRKYDAPSYETDYQNLSMMQIWYGYCVDGVWYDYPSENYDLVGILKHEEYTGWKAALASHMVKIGPYLLINVCVQADPPNKYTITDTLNSQIQEPFAQYNTYHYYYDEYGKKHSYMDDYSHGYGVVAENVAFVSDPEDATCYMRCEFMRHLYLILDYESLPADYELKVTITGGNSGDVETYSLTAEMIKELLGY